MPTHSFDKKAVQDCDFTDRLEEWSRFQTHLEFRLKDEEGAGESVVRGTIADIYAEDHADMILLADGRTFPVSQISSVDVREKTTEPP